MNVESLTYDLVTDPFRSFTPQAEWKGSLGQFDCQLSGGLLKAIPRVAMNGETARELLEKWLQTWSTDSFLNRGIEIGFRFNSLRTHEAFGASLQTTEVGHGVDTIVSLQMDQYPHPPSHLLSDSPLVRELKHQVRLARTPDQPMLAPGYLLLTLLEFEYGGKQVAARTLNVSVRVLSKLGYLTAMNDPDERRKVKGPIQHLTGAERVWVPEAMARITLQIATHEAGHPLARLDMGVLPSL